MVISDKCIPQMKRILFVTTLQPARRSSGGEIASAEIIRVLKAMDIDVTVLAFDEVDPRYHTSRWKVEAAIKAVICNTPITVQKFRSKKFQLEFQRVMTEMKAEGVILDHSNMTWIADLVRGVPVIYVAHNSESATYQQLAKAGTSVGLLKRIAYRREASLIARQEKLICRRAERIATFSSGDAEYLSTYSGDPKKIIELPLNPFPPAHISAKCVYDVGMIGSWTWDANLEGLLWFLNVAFPVENVRVGIAGRVPEGISRTMGRDNITFVGFVPNANEFLASCKVIVVPSISGTGIQIKTLEAISTGKSVVVTEAAIRGLNDLPANVHVARDANEFSMAINKCLSESEEERAYCLGELENWWMKRDQQFSAGMATILNAIK